MDLKARRRGASQSGICDLCGSRVDVRDLIQSEVQGLRGFYICSVHPREKVLRWKESFQDKGGISQVNDLEWPPEPAPDSGGWLDYDREVEMIAVKATTETRDPADYAADTTLTFGVSAGGKYYLTGAITSGVGDIVSAYFGGTAAFSYFNGVAFNDAESTAIDAATDVWSFSNAATKVLAIGIVCSTSGTLTMYWQAVSAPGSLRAGSALSLQQQV